MRNLCGNQAIKRSICAAITATTTGASVDTGKLGRRRGFSILTNGSLAASGTDKWTVTFEGSNDDVTFAAIDDAELIGSLKGAAVKAYTTVTMTDVGVNEDTLTIGTRVYELTTDGSVTAGRVAVDISGGASAAQTCAALITAINGDASAVATAAAGAGDTVIVTAITEVAATGNAIATTESLTNGTVTAATMAGGVDAVEFTLGTSGEVVINAAVGSDGLRGRFDYIGSKRYLRVVFTKAASAPNVTVAAGVEYSSRSLPVTM